MLQSPTLNGTSDQADISEVHVTLFDTETLSAEIIEALKCHLDRYPAIPLKKVFWNGFLILDESETLPPHNPSFLIFS